MPTSVTRHRLGGTSLLEYASKNREEEFFNDVIIHAGDEKISANRLVLSCYSPYFEGLFKFLARQKKYEAFVEIKTIDGKTMKALIDYIYKGSIIITDQNVISLLSGAKYLQLEDVTQFCCDFFLSNISTDNAVSVLNTANEFKNNALKEETLKYISSKLDQIVQTHDFTSISKDDLVPIILSINRNQAKSTSIYRAILIWTQHEVGRQIFFSELFQLINLSDFTIEFLEKVTLEEQLVKTGQDCEKRVLSVLFSKQKKLLEQTKIESLQKNQAEKNSKQFKLQQPNRLTLGEKATKTTCETKQSTTFQQSTILYFKEGKFDNTTVKAVYNLQNPEKPTILAIPVLKNFVVYTSLLLQNFIYVLGYSFASSGRKFWRINYTRQNKVWESVPLMNKTWEVRDMAWTVYNDALTGMQISPKWFRHSCKYKLHEYLEFNSMIWKTFAQPNQARDNYAFVSSDEYLYLLGGNVPNGLYSSSVERLRGFTASSWEYAASMQSGRGEFAAVCCCGEIYAIGGKTGSLLVGSKSVERYDSTSNSWNYVSDMNIARYGHAACVMNDRIYAVGGRGENEVAVKEIECYNPTDNTWTIVGKVSEELFEHSLLVL